MTQEELDALMDGDLDLDESEETLEDALEEAKNEIELEEKLDVDDSEERLENATSEANDEDNYRVEASNSWPPPPPTNDHQVVNQLDDVTRDSEVKATEIFDKLENINRSGYGFHNRDIYLRRASLLVT